MIGFTAAVTVALAVGVSAQKNKYTATPSSAVAQAAATALTRSPVSHVKGKAFDRVAFIWLENTDYELAAADPNLIALAKMGITLTNMNGVTHPSEPNYVASHGGDNFGMDNDEFWQIPGNVSSVLDLLADKGISWGAYQEDMPFSGFEGYQYVNQQTGANDYVRKHNPLVIFNSAANHANKLAQIKNFTMFNEDLKNNQLPQWMFITPNMTSDGHDTDVTVAGAFTSNFLMPLLNDTNFMNNTLVLITFDENETYTLRNTVFSILIGDAIPKNLVGTKDHTYYNHYSQISTVEANWGLHTLGRWDVGANVFKFVGEKTGDAVRKWTGIPAFKNMFFNQSFAGPYNSVVSNVTFPVPNTKAVWNGRTVLPSIVEKWGSYVSKTYYNTGIEIPDGQHPPAGYAN